MAITHPELMQSTPPLSVPSVRRGVSMRAVLIGFSAGCALGFLGEAALDDGGSRGYLSGVKACAIVGAIGALFGLAVR
jgi:hypothetical protein